MLNALGLADAGHQCILHGGHTLHYLSPKAWCSEYNCADATGSARTGRPKPEGHGLLQDVLRTAVRKKACVRWSQCFASCSRNGQLLISRETVRVQFTADLGMAQTKVATRSHFHCRA